MNIELKTARLTLRPLSVSDWQTTHVYASDKINCQYMIFLPNNTTEETKEFLQAVELGWQERIPRAYEFAICLDGKHIGAISLAVERKNVGELGWILNVSYQGNGYCTEAAFAIIEFARKIGFHRLVAHCDTRNIASYRVMEKLDMMRVGENSREYFDKRGKAREYEYVLDLYKQ